MIALLLLVSLVGLGLFIAGIRGRVIGEDPHCRTCRFNLRGRAPDSARCPECGTVLRDANVRIGLLQRSRGFIATGLILTVVGGTLPTIATLRWASGIDWSRWKTTSWLLDDLESTDMRKSTAAKRELRRRVDLNKFSPAGYASLMDQILARQADRTKKWNGTLGEIFEAAAWAQRVDPQRIERYIRQGVHAQLTIKPKLRRGQSISLDLDIKCDRFSPMAQLEGTWETAPLTLGGNVLCEANWASDQTGGSLAHSIGYGTGGPSSGWKRFTAPDGKHEMRSAVKMSLSMIAPYKIGADISPIAVEIPLSGPVELVAADAIVDDFKVDPELREQMGAAIESVRVKVNDSGNAETLLLIHPPPMSIAAEIVLAQGATTRPVGNLFVETTGKPRWKSVSSGRKPKLTGTVDVHIRPSQSAADHQESLGTYWGEEIVIKDITINAPYTPPFNRDESLRPTVEKALQTRPPTIKRTGNNADFRLSVSINCHSSPVKVAFDVFLSHGGREVKCTSGFIVPAMQNHGSSFFCKEVDPEGKATSCDVILRPKMDWEADSSDLTPPWFGEVVIRDVKIE